MMEHTLIELCYMITFKIDARVDYRIMGKSEVEGHDLPTTRQLAIVIVNGKELDDYWELDSGEDNDVMMVGSDYFHDIVELNSEHLRAMI